MEKLNLGVAYHGNRLLKHVKEDMQDIVAHNMNLVVHMFSHNDMKRHKNILKETFDITRDAGLDFWVDNWGLGGPPGDVSHILQYFPDAHQVYSNGEVDPVRVCFNSPDYLKFSKEWLDMVRECGGEKIFWDEPHFNKINDAFSCCCPRCKRLFEEKYGHPMPDTMTDEVMKFRVESISNYFSQVTTYANLLGMENIVCLMPSEEYLMRALMEIPNVSNVGTDPYWLNDNQEPYGFVYNWSKSFIDTAKELGKKTHIWLQTYRNPSGREDEIYLAAEAAYDAGARTIISWSYRGGEACYYKADNCDIVWQVTGDAMRRLKDRYIDEVREERRKIYMNK